MSHPMVVRHPAAPVQRRRRPQRAGSDWLLTTIAVALATVISLAVFALVGHYWL